MKPSIKQNLQKLKTFKSNLTNDNASDLTILIDEIKKELPEQYVMKLSVLKFFDNYNEAESLDNLPF